MDSSRTHHLWRVIGRIAESPGLTMAGGIVLLVTAGWEVVEGLEGGFELGAHHGIAAFGLIQVVAALPHCLHGVKEMHESHRSMSDGDAAK